MVQPNPAFHNHLCHHFLARDVVRRADQDLGAGEAIRLRFCTLTEMKQAMAEGSLTHVLALSALSRVFQMWDVPFEPE